METNNCLAARPAKQARRQRGRTAAVPLRKHLPTLVLTPSPAGERLESSRQAGDNNWRALTSWAEFNLQFRSRFRAPGGGQREFCNSRLAPRSHAAIDTPAAFGAVGCSH